MSLFKVEAINLKTTPFAEQDKLLTVFSKEKGKLSVIAKGARRPSSKFGGRCEIFAYNHLLIAKGKSLDILSQAETIETFQKVRDNPSAFMVAAYLARVVNSFLEEAAVNRSLFEVLLGCLKLFQAGVDPQFVATVFEIKFAAVEGFTPILDRCSHCGRKVKKAPQNIRFSDAAGGIVCEKCSFSVYTPRLVSFPLLVLSQKIRDQDFETLRNNYKQHGDLSQLSEIFVAYISEHLGKDISEWKRFGI
ncbi:MAG: DNA repair protein RecO [Candidatus Margulisbacteria bacterium]|nr:DNA repair protein RecO [Candidatus Margulisiibacteriota bacterium]MBU1022066.1 DNA repair protein RecO [Candidatus Margulisiibacteriota bacterium]MBU1729661.1 DNA repair protein RecO [Candidatus Margulisiibacteriota bacterium]MBU1954981.1 DNA repair protein RecO [Candidatus Margulisiibacteriota bacterium]